MAPDKRARRILLATYWSSAGWRQQPTTAPEDFAYAKGKGYMFDSAKLTHDQIVQRLLVARSAVTLPDVADAFVASLSNRRLEWRSALASLAFATHFPDHGIANSPKSLTQSGRHYCHICGQYDWIDQSTIDTHDLSMLNFERHKWGGVRRDDPLYAALDLELFAKADRQAAQCADYEILDRVLSAAKRMPAPARAKDLCNAIADLIPSNDSERRGLIGILALCGVLAVSGRPGYLERFTTHARVKEDRPADHRNDWSYPAIWWRGESGVSESFVARCFPLLRSSFVAH